MLFLWFICAACIDDTNNAILGASNKICHILSTSDTIFYVRQQIVETDFRLVVYLIFSNSNMHFHNDMDYSLSSLSSILSVAVKSHGVILASFVVSEKIFVNLHEGSQCG